VLRELRRGSTGPLPAQQLITRPGQSPPRRSTAIFGDTAAVAQEVHSTLRRRLTAGCTDGKEEVNVNKGGRGEGLEKSASRRNTRQDDRGNEEQWPSMPKGLVLWRREVGRGDGQAANDNDFRDGGNAQRRAGVRVLQRSSVDVVADDRDRSW